MFSRSQSAVCAGRFSGPLFEAAAERTLFSVSEQHRNIENAQMRLRQICRRHFLAQGVEYIAESGAGGAQVALKRARRAPKLGSDRIDGGLPLVQASRNRLPCSFDQ